MTVYMMTKIRVNNVIVEVDFGHSNSCRQILVIEVIGFTTDGNVMDD